jgi:hypothetical protein
VAQHVGERQEAAAEPVFASRLVRISRVGDHLPGLRARVRARDGQTREASSI